MNAMMARRGPNRQPNVPPKKSPEELTKWLYNIALADIPGWRREEETKRVKLTKPGRQWIKQMCYVLKRSDLKLEPFFDQLNLYFDVDDMEKLVEVVNKTIDRAFAVNKIEQKDGYTEMLKSDPEAQYLLELTNHMKRKDIPGLMPDEEMKPMFLSPPSLHWMQHRIRRIMLKNLFCLNGFLIKASCMFPTTILNVFSPPFRRELYERLLPGYAYKTEELHNLLDTSAEYLKFGPIPMYHPPYVIKSRQQNGNGKTAMVPTTTTTTTVNEQFGQRGNDFRELGDQLLTSNEEGYFDPYTESITIPVPRSTKYPGTVYTNTTSPSAGFNNNQPAPGYGRTYGVQSRPAVAATTASALSSNSGATISSAGSFKPPPRLMSATATAAAAQAAEFLSAESLEAELERQRHLQLAAEHLAAAKAIATPSSGGGRPTLQQIKRFAPY